MKELLLGRSEQCMRGTYIFGTRVSTLSKGLELVSEIVALNHANEP